MRTLILAGLSIGLLFFIVVDGYRRVVFSVRINETISNISNGGGNQIQSQAICSALEAANCRSIYFPEIVYVQFLRLGDERGTIIAIDWVCREMGETVLVCEMSDSSNVKIDLGEHNTVTHLPYYFYTSVRFDSVVRSQESSCLQLDGISLWRNGEAVSNKVDLKAMTSLPK